MRQTSLLEQRLIRPGAAMFWPHEGYTLNIALVYQDRLTREWAKEVQDLISTRLGDEAVRCTEWEIGRLKENHAFAEGVETLAQADVIAIACRPDEFPAEFYLWVNLWLQMRSRLTGVLVALLGRTGPSGSEPKSAQKYLEAVAAQGRLEFLLKEYDAPGQSPFHRRDMVPLAEAA